MAKPVYRNYQLHRTLPKLSGNMQLDLILDVTQADGYVTQAHIRPISKIVNYNPIVDERIMDRPHQLNIKRFYEKTRSGFYEQSFEPRLKSDWPMMISAAEMPDLKYIKEFDDTYFAGCQRMSYKLYGCTHEILVPVWLDHCCGIKFNIHVGNTPPSVMGTKQKTAMRTVSINISKEYLAKTINSTGNDFHRDFTKYLMDYFDYVGITSGSNNVMFIDFKQNISTISGLLVESGNYATRQNLNITKNLLYRERPLLEANSLITNTFMDYKMIATQLINFNLCFNINTLIDSVDNISNGYSERLNVWVDVDYLIGHYDKNDKYIFEDPDFANLIGCSWRRLPLADFYTNHHYIPKQIVRDTYSDSTNESYNDGVGYPRNVLDYKRDYECTDLMHQNKMSQSICHWYYADQPEGQLFNVYDGFGAYDLKTGNEYSHGFGATLDINDDAFDESLDNTVWCGPPRVDSDQSIANILNAPWPWVERGYFKNASGFINGIKFPYDELLAGYNPNSTRNAPSAVYFGTAITPTESGRFAWWTAQTDTIGNPHAVAIITERINNAGINDLPDTQIAETSDDDLKYDWHKYSDADNRFVLINKAHKELRAYFDPTGNYLNNEAENPWIWLPKVSASHMSDPINVPANIRNPQYNGKITRTMLVRIGGYELHDTSYRNESNVNGLFIHYLRSPINKEVETEQPNNPLFVIFKTRRSNNITKVAENIVYEKMKPSAITLGGIRNALHNYWVKYSPIIEMINRIAMVEDVEVPQDLPDVDDLQVIVNIMENIESPEILYFHKSITEGQDITVSIQAHEHNYYKADNANEYVCRYSGSIKPAIYPVDVNFGEPRVSRDETNKTLAYNGWYGRNFMWYKTPIFALGQSLPVNLARYINKNIAPRYPSLDYEVVNPLIINDSSRPTIHGDMMYDEIPPIYFGQLIDTFGNLIDRGSFTPANFEFERTGNANDSGFSFASQVLNQQLDNFAMVDPSNPDGTSDKKFYYLNPKYNELARKAVKENIFNVKNLKNRSNNYIGYWLFADEYSTYEWAEFKWFNQSYVMTLPEKVVMTNDENELIETNDKGALENKFLTKLLECLRGASKYPDKFAKFYDKAFLRATYDLSYDLQKIEPEDDKPLYSYKYIVTATLK